MTETKTETLTLTVSSQVKSRIDLAAKELGLQPSEVVTEAFNVYFRKLLTDGKITADVSYISLSDSESETEYSLEDTEHKTYTLTQQEISRLAPSQLKNYNKAMNGDPKALNVIGTYYESGNGLDKDYDKAIYWYTLAAEKGNNNAQYHLGVLYNKAKDNPLRAYMWFELARLCGFNITAMHKDYILRLTERLSARQMKSAQEEAARKFAQIQRG